MAEALVGIIGGSGVDQIEGLVNQEWREVNSPFGCPSDKLLFGRIADNPIVFLPRHGRGHRLSPSWATSDARDRVVAEKRWDCPQSAQIITYRRGNQKEN